jgi:signal transduction histidine kinase/CheY-like chemotaxis protein
MATPQNNGIFNIIKLRLKNFFYSDFHLILLYLFYLNFFLSLYFIFIINKKLIGYVCLLISICQYLVTIYYDDRYINLEKKNYLLSNCLDSLPSLFLIFDKDWNVIFANDIFQAFSIGKNFTNFSNVLEGFSENEELCHLLEKGREVLNQHNHFSETINIDEEKAWKLYMGILKKSNKDFYVCYISDVCISKIENQSPQLILNDYPEGVLIFDYKNITYINNTLLKLMEGYHITNNMLIEDLKKNINKKNFLTSYKREKEKILLKFEKIKEGELIFYKVLINENILRNMNIYGDDNELLGVLLVDNDFNIIETNNKFNNFVNSYFVKKTNFLQYIDTNKQNIVKNYFKEKESKEVQSINMSLGEKNTNSFILHANNLDNNGWLIFLQDNTNQINLETQLLHSQRLGVLGQVLTSVSHDFNNILTSISGFCDILSNKIPITDEKYFLVLQIKHNCNRAINLVKYMLYLSKKTIPESEENTFIELNEIVSNLIGNMGRLLGENIKINFIKNNQNIIVNMPSINLEQILLNLIVNARDAMKHGGVITVTTTIISNINIIDHKNQLKDTCNYVELSVTDTGEGISEVNKQKIFDPFFTTKKEGTGLGLATIQAIVHQYLGIIKISSKVNFGTTFKIYLPISNKEKKTEPTNKEKVFGNIKDNNKNQNKDIINVILLEDDISIRNLLQEGLKKKNYLNVYSFKSFKDCMNHVGEMTKKNEKIDLIISDIMIVDGNGLELVSAIKSTSLKTKFILISGYDKEHLESLKNYNVLQKYNNDIIFLEKPFSIQEMLILIDSFYEHLTTN